MGLALSSIKAPRRRRVRPGKAKNPPERIRRTGPEPAFLPLPAISPAAIGRVQTKLEIGPADDKFEREADRVADQVMRMPLPGVASSEAAPLAIQRTCGACEKERAQRKCAACEEADVPERIEGLRGGGKPLSADLRAFFEPRFGRDFGDVRVHTDSRAAETASAINARGYTVGRDVFFGAGQYVPDSNAGRRLMAHELTHVVQQSSSRPAVQRQTAETETNKPPATESSACTAGKGPSENCAKGIGFLQSMPPQPGRPILGKLFFCLDSSALGKSEKRLIESKEGDYRRQLDKEPLLFAFQGLADVRGSEKHNLTLSRNRALCVRNHFMAVFGDHKNFKVVTRVGSKGEAISDPDSHVASRRVDIGVKSLPKPKPKRSTLNEALKRSREVLKKHKLPGERHGRVLCLLKKLEMKEVNDHFFNDQRNKNWRRKKIPKGGCLNFKLTPDLFISLKKDVTHPDFAPPDQKRIPDKVVRQNLERTDVQIMAGLDFLRAFGAESSGMDCRAQKIRKLVADLQTSKTSIYHCYAGK